MSDVRVIRNPFNGTDLRYADLIWKGNPLEPEFVAFFNAFGGIVNVSLAEWNRLR